MKILILRNAERGKLCPIFVLIKKGNEQKLTRRARAHPNFHCKALEWLMTLLSAQINGFGHDS